MKILTAGCFIGDLEGGERRAKVSMIRWSKRLRFTEIVAAATIPFLSGFAGNSFPIKIAIGALGVLVAVVASLLGLLQLQEHWIEYRATAESLRKEKFLFLTQTEPSDKDDAFKQVRASWEKIAAKFLGLSSKMTPLQRFLKWSVSDRRSRTISTFSNVTVPEWLEDEIKEGTVEWLRAAMQVDPANARVTAHLGRRLADQALEQDSDPDEARRARGEADFLTNRARKLAPDSAEVKKLREEVVELLELQDELTRFVTSN